jgi:hypothetical protein
VAAVLLLQAGLTALLVRPAPRTPARPSFGARLHLIVDADPGRPLAGLPAFVDPGLFSLPSLEGFSGAAWLRYPLLEHAPTERAESPEWLRLRPAALGEEFFQYLATNTLTPPLLVDEPLPPVLRTQGSYPSEPVAFVSRLRIEGDLAQRGWLGPLDLPSWAHSEIVSNTVIRVAADAAGETFSATIVERSGLRAADDYASQVAAQARFRPARSAGRSIDVTDLTWGTLVFLWHTDPLPATNRAPNANP